MNLQTLGKKGTVTAMVGVALITGIVGGSALHLTDANAQTTNATTAATTTDQSSNQVDPSKGGHSANGKTEQLLTGNEADKAKAAALKAVPGGTIERVETDAEGDAYEAHMTKSDGSRVTVKFDSNFNVVKVEDGPNGPMGGQKPPSNG